MSFAPDDTLPPESSAAVCAAYGLGTPVETVFVARGSMGAVNRITTELGGRQRRWTVKRSYWQHYTEDAVRREVDFTERCREVGVPGPRSISQVDGSGLVLSLEDQPDSCSQYRVLEWLDGEVGREGDPDTTVPIAGWLAAIHRLAVDPAGQPVHDWFIRVGYAWDELARRLAVAAPDIAEIIRTRETDLWRLTELVNHAPQGDPVWCHTDVGPDNLIWLPDGPYLIDWENSGPLVPVQELGSVVRAAGERGTELYAAYRRAGGPAVITEPTDLATAVAVHLNYLGTQSEMLLDDTHPEQHDFARNAATKVGSKVPTLAELEKWIIELRSVN